jgi:hypothetical protein
MKAFFKWFGIAVVFLLVIVIVLLAVDYILPPGLKLGPEYILAIAAAGVSLMFSYWKAVRLEFAALSETTKALVNVIAVVLVAAIMYSLVCTNLLLITGLVCSSAGLQTLLTYVAIALVLNQTFDYFSVDAPDVKALKAGTVLSSTTASTEDSAAAK